MTSWRVSASIASMRSISARPNAAMAAFPRTRIVCAAAVGMLPSSAIASAARASISNQILNRFSGAQMAAMAGRVYRGTMPVL